MALKLSDSNPVYELHSLLEAIRRGDQRTSDALVMRLRSMSLSLAADNLLSRLQALAFKRPRDSRFLLSSLNYRRSLRGTSSIVTACMNRNANLLRSIPSWLALDVNEIVVVDWGSSEPVRETLEGIRDARLVIIEVPAANWCLTAAFNLGLQFASGERIYKVDADISLEKGFLFDNSFKRSEFVRGYWKEARDNGLPDQAFVNGTFGAFRADLISIGFYNEAITTYGWDDTDLYQRLTALGRRGKTISLASFGHAEHSDDERLGNQNIQGALLFNSVPATEFHNKKNEELVKLLPEWRLNQVADYEMLFRLPNLVEAYPVGDKIEVSTEHIILAQQRAYLFFHKRFYNTNLDGAELQRATEEYCGTKVNQDAPLETVDRNHFWSLDVIAELGHHDLFDCYFSPGAELDVIFESLGQTVEVRALPESMSGLARALHPSPNEKFRQQKVLVTSLFEEKNAKRRHEYQRCLRANLGYFDHVIILMESETGAFIQEALEGMPVSSRCRLLTVPITKRPTLELLFKVANSLAVDRLVAVANADILFNESFDLLLQAELDRTMIVLSRREGYADEEDEPDNLIRLVESGINGLPNTFSADCWAFRAPLPVAFDAHFEIGTFNCDSYLNKTLSDASMNVYNPCLSLSIDHIHSPEYNSSDHKRIAHEEKITAEYALRKDKSRDGEPKVGVQWCYVDDIKNSPALGRKTVFWTSDYVRIKARPDNRLAPTILFVFLLQHYAEKYSWPLSIFLEFEQGASQYLYRVLLKLSCFRLPNNIYLSPKSSVDTRDEEVEIRNTNLESVASGLCESHSFHDFLYLLGCSADTGDSDSLAAAPVGLFVSQSDFTMVTLMRMLPKNCRSGVEEFLQSVRSCYGMRLGLNELDEVLSERSGLDLPYMLVPSLPPVTVVTSTYSSEEFFEGYLENIAAALDEVNGLAHIVDANSPGNEQEIFENFVAANPDLKNRFKYTRLNQDPGLYACWELAIRKSETPYISNGNTDDRRSPFHLAALLKVLIDQPDLAAACSALKVTREKNCQWFDKTNDETWFEELDFDVFGFDGLYTTDQFGLLKSQNLLHCMPLWRKELHSKYGYFNEQRYGTSADWAFWLACAADGQKFGLLREVLGMYLINPESHNRRNDLDGALELRIINEFFSVNQKVFISQ